MSTQMGPKNQSVPRNGEPFFDYGVQYITAEGEEFGEDLRRWEQLGLCSRLPSDQVGTASTKDGFTPFGDDGEAGGSFVGHGGMGVLATKIIDDIEREFPSSLTVNRGFPDQKRRVTGLSKTADGGWTLRTKGGAALGPFTAVVGAFGQHCLTDPFLSTGGVAAEDVLSCLRRVESNQLIVAQVSFRPTLGVAFAAAHVRGEECLSFIANNARKPHQDGSIKDGDRECWTLISSASFAEREYSKSGKGYRKAAEEHMLAAFQRVLRIPDLSRYSPHINRISHWEDGLSVNCPPSPRPGCLFDAEQSLGWCGDFCTDRPNLEGAAESGRAMAGTLESFLRDSEEKKGLVESGYLPSNVVWVPRVVDNIPGSGSLVDIGQFGHGSRSLPDRFTHTDLVPSYVDGYLGKNNNPQRKTEGRKKKPSGAGQKKNASRRPNRNKK